MQIPCNYVKGPASKWGSLEALETEISNSAPVSRKDVWVLNTEVWLLSIALQHNWILFREGFFCPHYCGIVRRLTCSPHLRPTFSVIHWLFKLRIITKSVFVIYSSLPQYSRNLRWDVWDCKSWNPQLHYIWILSDQYDSQNYYF